MLIKINGEDFELPNGSTIAEAIELSNAPYSEGSIISLIKGTKEFEKNINKFKVKTSKGSIIIELIEQEYVLPLVEFFKENYMELSDKYIRWNTSNEIAIGPLLSDFEGENEEFRYKQWDVILSLSGFSKESTHIIFFKEDNKGIYGAVNINHGIFAKIIGGKKTLKNLGDEDKIIAIEPIIERSSVVDSASVSDLNSVLEEGNQLFTYVLVEPNPNSPQSVEHLFSLVNNDKLQVDYESNSFLGFYGLQGLKKDKEEILLRKRGTVTLRNDGVGLGKVYFYREDRVTSNSHTVIGHIRNGMELIDIAKEEDFITIKSSPERILTLDISQIEAEELLKLNGIKQERDGVTDDEAIVVFQEPKYTMDILKEGKVKTFAINKEDLVEIELYDNAPRSVLYFKKVTDLIVRPIGQLKVHFAFEGMKLAIFEGDTTEAKGLVPENVPKNTVESYAIGLTNMSRKNVGLLGVRFEDSDEYGPTAEPFNGTNILGKVLNNLDHLEKLKENDILYIKEKKD